MALKENLDCIDAKVRFSKNALAISILLLLCSITATTQTIVVGTKHAPPFVLQDDVSLQGFSIDLIRELVKEVDKNLEIEFRFHSNIKDHLEAIQKADVDLAIAATTINSKREHSMEFSYPFYQSGVGILTLAIPQRSTWQIISNNRHLTSILLALAIYIIICAHIIWLLERHGKELDKRWPHGVFEGAWWTVVTMSTVGYGDVVPRRAISKILAIFIIFSGIVLFGMVVASFSSALTISELKSSISGPEDLVGKRVVVVAGTTGEQTVEKIYAQIISVENLQQAIEMLGQNKVDAVVHDKPLLEYYTKQLPQKNFIVLRSILEPANYGICFPLHSPWRKKVNIALLKIMENGTYLKLRNKWFKMRNQTD